MTWIIAIIGVLLPLFFGNDPDEKWQYFSMGAGVVGGAWLLVTLVDKLKVTFVDLAAVVLGGWLLFTKAGGVPPVVISPKPEPTRKPILPWRGDAQAFMESDGEGPEGREVTVDIPPAYRKKNIAAKGLGCCVFRSLDHNAHDSQTRELYGFPEWMVQKGIEGGGYPSKVDKLIKQICQDRGVPTTAYLQHEGGEEAFLDAAMKTGRSVGVTYAGKDPRYGLNTGIDHMVSLVYLDDKYACILDNNFVETYLWMTRKEFLDRWRDRGGGWAVLLLDAPAPQPPKN